MSVEQQLCQWRSGPKHSHLCKDLLTTLTEDSPDSPMEYFIQFMESISAVHLIQFWLSVESFKSAVLPSDPTHGAPETSTCDAAHVPSTHSTTHENTSEQSEVSGSHCCTPRRDGSVGSEIHREITDESMYQQHRRSFPSPTRIDITSSQSTTHSDKQVNSAPVLV